MTSPMDVTGAPIRRPGETGKTGLFWRPGLVNPNPSPGGPGSGPIEIRVSGPVFDGSLGPRIVAMLEEIKYVVASQGLAEWHLNLDRSLRHPTPYYETQVTLQRQADDWVTHDRGIVYGPWLEGTSSRNQSTRFKGYGSLRRAIQELIRKVPSLLEPVVRRHVEGMGG